MAISISSSNVTIDRDGLSFSGGMPGAVLLMGNEEREVTWSATPGGVPQVRSRLTPLGASEESVFSWTFLDGFRLEWHVTWFARQAGFSVRTIFTNESESPVRLRRLDMLQSVPAALQADSADWFVMAPFCGWKQEGEGPLVQDSGKPRQFTDAMSITSQQGRLGLFVSAVGPAESDVTITLAGTGPGYGLGVFSEMTDIVVDPGESRTSEEVLFLFGPHQEAYADVLRWLTVTHGSRTHRGPFTGWCSWYEQYSNITAAHVQAVAGAVREKRDQIPQAVIQIDEGYQRHWGDWRTNQKFPEGWKPVVEAIRAAGAIPGVWLAPLGVFDVTGVMSEHPDWFQKASGAFEPNGGNWREGTLHYLDPTHPGVREFIRNMIRNAKGEGFRYFKIDFNHVKPARYHDPKATRFQALRGLYRLYREEMGEDTYLNSCIVAMSRAVMGYVDAMRIGGDSDYHWSGGCGILDAICATAAHTAPANGVVAAADPDVYYIKARGTTLTTEQLQSWQGFVGLLGGVTMTSEPVHRADYADSLRELEICTPPVPDHGHALLPGMELYPSLFGFVAERGWGRFASVLMFNAADKPGDVPLVAPELEALGTCHVWSFREQSYLGCFAGDYIAEKLPAWGSRLVRLTPVSPENRPVLIGSDLHIGMGSAEVAMWRVTADTIEFELSDAGARSGAVWIYSEKPLALERVEQGTAAVEAAGPNLWRICISGRQRGRGQRLRLAVGRGVRKAVGPDPLSGVEIRLHTLTSARYVVQGAGSVNGMVRVDLCNRGSRGVDGEAVLSVNKVGAVELSTGRIPYRIQAGETLSQPVEVIPKRNDSPILLAAKVAEQAPWTAWTAIAMERLELSIPGAEDSRDALSRAVEAMPYIQLPGQPGVAGLRMAASARHLWVDIQVQDEKPSPNPVAFWEGSCVELFAAMPGARERCQIYAVPDVERATVEVNRVLSTRSGEKEACPDARTELRRMPGGYALTMLVPFEKMGLTEGVSQFLLDFQVSRWVNGAVENVPLLGSRGAFNTSCRYAQVNVDCRSKHDTKS